MFMLQYAALTINHCALSCCLKLLPTIPPFLCEKRFSFSIHIDSPTMNNAPSYLLHEVGRFISVDIVS